MPNIKDVAREAGVSPMTVSYVINNHPAVKASTREHVLAVIERVGYQPSAAARGLQRRRMGAVGVLYGFTGTSIVLDHYLGHVLDGILDANESLEQKTVLFREKDWHTAAAKVPLFTDGYCDGLIVITPALDTPVISAISARNVPFVVVGAEYDDPAIASVDIDNHQCARDITQYLISLGHREIAHIAGPENSQCSRQRIAGYRDAMTRAGLPVDENWIVHTEYYVADTPDTPLTFLQSCGSRRPTAIVCSDDHIALRTLDACREMGIRVPQDISITGIDDAVEAQYADPKITTMRQPVTAIGRESAQLLHKLIQKRHRPEAVIDCLQVRLSTELIVRESAAPR
jgi:DNA-binding LacI/PurR family transcriptional regulator